MFLKKEGIYIAIITNLKINKELSKVTADMFEKKDISRQCYSNVLNIIKGFIDNGMISEDVEVAYGYYGNPNIRMYRHCFLILKGNSIIDPTSYEIVTPFIEYHIFKILTMKEYIKLIDKFYETRQSNESPWMEYMIPEEKLYYEYVVDNKICIDEFSYNNFLMQYDKDRKVIIVNDEIEGLLRGELNKAGE